MSEAAPGARSPGEPPAAATPPDAAAQTARAAEPIQPGPISGADARAVVGDPSAPAPDGQQQIDGAPGADTDVPLPAPTSRSDGEATGTPPSDPDLAGAAAALRQSMADIQAAREKQAALLREAAPPRPARSAQHERGRPRSWFGLNADRQRQYDERQQRQELERLTARVRRAGQEPTADELRRATPPKHPTNESDSQFRDRVARQRDLAIADELKIRAQPTEGGNTTMSKLAVEDARIAAVRQLVELTKTLSPEDALRRIRDTQVHIQATVRENGSVDVTTVMISSEQGRAGQVSFVGGELVTSYNPAKTEPLDQGGEQLGQIMVAHAQYHERRRTVVDGVPMVAEYATVRVGDQEVPQSEATSRMQAEFSQNPSARVIAMTVVDPNTLRSHLVPVYIVGDMSNTEAYNLIRRDESRRTVEAEAVVGRQEDVQRLKREGLQVGGQEFLRRQETPEGQPTLVVSSQDRALLMGATEMQRRGLGLEGYRAGVSIVEARQGQSSGLVLNESQVRQLEDARADRDYFTRRPDEARAVFERHRNDPTYMLVNADRTLGFDTADQIVRQAEARLAALPQERRAAVAQMYYAVAYQEATGQQLSEAPQEVIDAVEDIVTDSYPSETAFLDFQRRDGESLEHARSRFERLASQAEHPRLQELVTAMRGELFPEPEAGITPEQIWTQAHALQSIEDPVERETQARRLEAAAGDNADVTAFIQEQRDRARVGDALRLMSQLPADQRDAVLRRFGLEPKPASTNS